MDVEAQPVTLTQAERDVAATAAVAIVNDLLLTADQKSEAIDAAIDKVTTKRKSSAGEKKEARRKRVKVERVDVPLPTAIPWQTEPRSNHTFEINRVGTVEQHSPTRDGHTPEPLEPIAWPASISVRDTPANMAVVHKIKAFLDEGRTAKACNVGRGANKAMELQFGRTVEDDLKYLPEFTAQQDYVREAKERDEKRTEEIRSKHKERADLHRKFKEYPYIGAEEEMLALMTTKEYVHYDRLKYHAICGALHEAMKDW